MSTSTAKAPATTTVVDAVRTAIEAYYTKLCGDAPQPVTGGQSLYDCECIAGIISFVGDASLSVAWIIDSGLAPVIGHKLARFPIPFDSPDMIDLGGELVNIVAGDIALALEAKRLHVKMSLPTVIRGTSFRLRMMPDKGAVVTHLNYRTQYGQYWLRIATQPEA